MTSIPRILVVLGKLDRGGAERHLLQVMPRLLAHGMRMEIFALHAGGVLTAAMSVAGVRVIEGTARRGLLGVLVAAARLAVFLRKRPPDVVHFILPEAYVIGAVCALIVPGLRRVMSRRSLNNYQQRYPGMRMLERCLHRSMHAVLGNSRAVVRQLIEEGVDESRLGLIYNGIEPRGPCGPERRREARQRLGLADDALIGLTVANLIPYKGHADLLLALSRLRPMLPPDSIWLCVGRDDGPGATLAAQTVALGLGKTVRWVGEQQEVTDYLAAADLAVLPSHQEGFSNAVLEGMAAALPMVVTRVGGNPEAILDGICGLVVPPHDPEALASAIGALVVDETLRRKLGTHAFGRVQQQFSLSRCVELYAELYRNLTRNGRAPIPRGAQP